MVSKLFERLIDYFQQESEGLNHNALRACIFENKPDIGSTRENILLGFLSRHLPRRCDIMKGGYIFDSEGNESGQIDLIITNDLTLQFKQSSESLEKSLNCIEGCYCAIAVKSFLSDNDLTNAIDNLRSIPKEKVLAFANVVGNADMMIGQLPGKFLFAFDGISIESILKHLQSYMDKNDVTSEELPDFIIVNRKYYLSKVALGGYNDPRGFVPPGFYVNKTKGDFIGGIGLAHMITRIQKLATVGSFLLLDFDRYYVQLKIAEENMSKHRF